MGNLKQRLIKPGRDFNYAEGVKVRASAAIYADQIVYVTGSEGPYLKAAPADADDAAKTIGRLMIAKHAIPVDGYGIVLPWKLVTSIDTSTPSVGDPVFLADTISAAAGGNLTFTAPTDAKNIIVGRVTVSATVANGGAILVHADAPEARVQGGSYSATNTAAVGCAMEQVRVVLNDATDVDLTFDYPIVVTAVHTIGAGSTSTNGRVKNGTTNTIAQVAFGSADAVTRATSIDDTYVAVAAGTVLRIDKSGAGDAGDVIIVTFIRG